MASGGRRSTGADRLDEFVLPPRLDCFRREGGATLRVLVVEDDVNVAGLVRHLLEAEGWVSALSIDIDGALDILSGEPPDLALIDLGLSKGESGWDLVERIRASDRFGDLPIVILTGEPKEDVLSRAEALDCGYLGKPFSPPALVDRIQIAIRKVGKAPGQRPVEVILLLSGYRVEGTVYVPVELERFSDAWEAIVRDAREYIPVTDARVIALGLGDAVGETDFVQVRKADVRVAFARDAIRE